MLFCGVCNYHCHPFNRTYPHDNSVKKVGQWRLGDISVFSTVCLKKTGPLRLIWHHNFTSSQHLLIISGTLFNWQNTVKIVAVRCYAYSAAIAVTRCLSVCPSVTFESCAKTNKNIFEIFLPYGSQAILVFPYQTGWRCSDGNPPPLTGASNARGMKKFTIFDQYIALSQKRL